MSAEFAQQLKDVGFLSFEFLQRAFYFCSMISPGADSFALMSRFYIVCLYFGECFLRVLEHRLLEHSYMGVGYGKLSGARGGIPRAVHDTIFNLFQVGLFFREQVSDAPEMVVYPVRIRKYYP